MAEPVPLNILRGRIEFPPDFTVFLLILTGFSWNFPVFMDHKREDVAERKSGGGGGGGGEFPKCWRMIVKWQGWVKMGGEYFYYP
jgi:hypothetical protein